MVCEFVYMESQSKLCHLDLRLLGQRFPGLSAMAGGAFRLRIGWFWLRPDWTVGGMTVDLSPKIASRMKTCEP